VNTTDAPYIGLDYFLEEDAELFFGRDDDRKRIIGNLRASRLTLLYSESGVGKSSLLRAGVSARLRQVVARRAAGSGSARFVPVVFSAWRGDTKADLIAALEAAARPLVNRDAEFVVRRDTLEAAIEDVVDAADATPLLILDQFEEHFLYAADDDPFDDELAHCINRADLRAHFLISIREDAYPLIGPRFKARIPNIYGNYLHLDFLDERAGRDAILEPINALNGRLAAETPRYEAEPALVEAVLEQVRRGRVSIGGDGEAAVATAGRTGVETAYLQLVMKRLWDEEIAAGSQRLRLDTLRDLGGADTIVHGHLEDVMATLPEDQREAAAAAFRFLVTSSGRKIALSADELTEFSDAALAPLQPALAHLERERILRPVPASEPGGVGRHEIYHDVLAPAILAWYHRYETQRAARELAARERDEARRRWLRRLRRGLLLAGSVVVAVVTVLALIAWRQSREARDQSRIATSRELAATSRAQLGTDPELGVLLAGEALRRHRTDEATAALRAALAADRSLAVLPAGNKPVRDLDATRDGKRLLAFGDDGHVRVWAVDGHKRLLDIPASASAVTDARFSPDGRRIVSAGRDGRIVVWDARSGRRLLTLAARRGGVIRAGWAPDGGRILAATTRDVTVWDGRSGRRLQVLRPPGGAIQSARWEPQTGRQILTATRDGAVRLWNARSGEVVASLDTGSSLRDAIFSDRGTAIVTMGAADPTATVWSPGTGRKLVLRPPRGGGPLLDATFDHSGERVATAGLDRSVRIWDARTGATETILTGHGSYVTAIAFSPDDSTVATASNDRTARTWDASSGDQLSVLRGHNAWISGLSFPTFGLIATAGADGDVRLWRTGERELAIQKLGDLADSVSFSDDGALIVSATYSGVELRRWKPGGARTTLIPVPGGINTASLSPDGRFVVVGAAYDEDPSAPARIFRVPSGRPSGAPLRIAGRRNGAVTAAFSPDGRLVVTTHRDGAARLWSSRSHRALRRLGPTSPPSSQTTLLDAQFSPDGRRVATVGKSGIARIFDTASGRQLESLPVAGGKLGVAQLNAVAFQPGGRLVATAGEDGQALLWDPGTRLTRPLEHDDAVTSVAFSPNGALVLTGSADGGVRLWDARTAQPLGVLERSQPNPEEPHASVAFSPDGRRLAVADGTRQVRVLECEICGSVADLERSARDRVSRTLTPQERRDYLGGLDG
jgi:WD40 repeat protein